MYEELNAKVDKTIKKHELSPVQIRNIHILLGFIAMLFFIILINSDSYTNMKHYNKAIDYMYEEDYASAVDEFYGIYKEYKDSDVLLTYCLDVINYESKKANNEEFIMLTKAEPKFSYLKEEKIEEFSGLYLEMLEYSDGYTIKRAISELEQK